MLVSGPKDVGLRSSGLLVYGVGMPGLGKGRSFLLGEIKCLQIGSRERPKAAKPGLQLFLLHRNQEDASRRQNSYPSGFQ